MLMDLINAYASALRRLDEPAIYEAGEAVRAAVAALAPHATIYRIRHADGKRWRTMDGIGMPDWTEDESQALGLTLREHADAFAADDPEDVRIEEIVAAPINMVLHCPACGTQHVDRRDPPLSADWDDAEAWTNPPHRSHLCHNPACKHVWRPADVATNGVAAVKTRGKADSPIVGQVWCGTHWRAVAIALAESNERWGLTPRRLHAYDEYRKALAKDPVK